MPRRCRSSRVAEMSGPGDANPAPNTVALKRVVQPCGPRRVEGPAGKFRIALPAEPSRAEVEADVACVRCRERHAVALQHRGERACVRRKIAAFRGEGELQDGARRLGELERPRVDLAEHPPTQRMHGKPERCLDTGLLVWRARHGFRLHRRTLPVFASAPKAAFGIRCRPADKRLACGRGAQHRYLTMDDAACQASRR